MENIKKANKIHKCDKCNGNIQKGEKYISITIRSPSCDDADIQIGVKYYSYKHHNRDCASRLLHFDDVKNIMKSCNFGNHIPCYVGPDDYEKHCKYCGMLIQS